MRVPTLTHRQKRFCKEYLVDYNGTAAAMRAGYSENGARVRGCNNLQNPLVKEYMKTLTDKTDTGLKITAERVLNELARIGFSDVSSYYKKNAHGRTVMKSLEELTPDQCAAISDVDLAKGTYKLHSKDSALDKLGKYLKLFTELHETQHTFTMMPSVKRNGVSLKFDIGTPKKQ